MRSAVVVALSVALISGRAFAEPPPAAAPAKPAAPAASPAPSPTPVAVAAAPTAVVASPKPLREDVITPMGAVWRSSLFPGWGQRYKGEKKKGWFLTGLATASAAATVGSYFYMQSARADYDNLTGEGAPYDQKYNQAVNATVLFDGIAAFTGGVYLYSLIDSGFTPLEHLRIKDARVKDVFPAMNKFYESNPVLVISVENRSSEPVSKVKVKFEAKGIMDLPAESAVVDAIPPGLGRSIQVTAAFNKEIFEVGKSEPKAVQAKITVEYEVGRKRRELVRTASFTVYNRNAIVWDDMRKMAAFVTPREEGVKAFASLVAQRKVQVSTVKSLAVASAYFDALSAYGMTYVSDPTAPFNYFDGNAEAVDYIAYPRETLARKTGDCDDLTALYSSLLESSGIPTLLVDVPGHVFMMFDSGLTPEEIRRYTGTTDGSFVVRNGSAWIPVEVTAVGKSFSEAWKLAATEVKKWTGLNQMALVEVGSAQGQFPPSPPDFGALSLADLNDGGFATRFALLVKEDAANIGAKEKGARDQAVAAIRARNLAPAAEENEIGIVFARDGQIDEAIRHFKAAIEKDPKLAKAYNNLANVHYLQGNSREAIAQYLEALRVGGENAAILINVANLYFEEGDAANAKAYFERAVRIEPVYEREYPEIADLLRNDAKMAKAAGAGRTAGKAAGIGAGERDPRRSRWIP